MNKRVGWAFRGCARTHPCAVSTARSASGGNPGTRYAAASTLRICSLRSSTCSDSNRRLRNASRIRASVSLSVE